MQITSIIYPVIMLIVSIVYCTIKKDKNIWFLMVSIVISIPMMFLFSINLKSMIITTILGILFTCGYNDIKYRKIDNFSILIILILSFFCSNNVISSLIRFLLISIIMLILISLDLIHMGGGDIKLLCAIAPLLDINSYLMVLIVSSITAVFGYVIVSILNKYEKYSIPFGFYIFIGVYLLLLII